VEIVFHAHGAVLAETTRLRARGIVAKLAARVRRPVNAIVWVQRDGPFREVEIVLHAPRRRSLVGQGRGRTFGPALTQAADNLGAQLARAKRKRRPSARAGVRR
jgi:ribosome-associated translation inhibitor RaiA